MKVPDPTPGLVIRYSFLWSHERKLGKLEGSKDRPCAIVLAARRQGQGLLTIVAPITHRPPDEPTSSVEIPAHICRRLGLDSARHWLRFDELNQFWWPGYDLRRLPSGRYDYGMLPQEFFEEILRGIMRGRKGRRQVVISRDE